MMSALTLRPFWAALSVDVRNAFNTRHRGQILDAVYANDKLQVLWRLVDWAYGRPSHLWVVDNGDIVDTILSTQGVKQGDSLASFLFSLSMAGIYSEIENASAARVVAVQDDVCLLGAAKDVIAGYRTLQHCLRGTGLCIEPSKSTALAHNDVRVLLESEGFDVSNTFFSGLGTCISRDLGVVSDWVEKRTAATHTPLFDVLKSGMISAQAAFHILRRSAIPAMNYWSRAVPPEALAAAANMFDAMVFSVAQQIFKLGPTNETVKNQMILPVRFGGLGLTSLKLISPIAWLCSLGQAASTLTMLLPEKTQWKNGWLNKSIREALKSAGGAN